ncbi:hypothetical protein [Bacillus sp. 2205SS5-2]|uniref:hypothetical protein n=1 Tax=Bacillus sp. 2205SS5-2 TaxID=3109031 RepID=UPI0030076350
MKTFTGKAAIILLVLFSVFTHTYTASAVTSESSNLEKTEEKNVIELGMNQREVVKVLGDSYEEVYGKSLNSNWRFDITSTDYSFKSDGRDTVDLEAVYSGEVEKIVFVEWDNNKVQSFIVYTKAEAGVEENRIFPDGTEKSIVISL